METVLHNAWSLFVAIGWFFLNRITAKVDALEKEKADKSSVNKHYQLIHETDKRVDGLQHTTVPRPEYKSDIKDLHARINNLVHTKEDRVKDIRLVNAKQMKKEKDA